MARGKNLFGSVLKETPEIAYDAQRVAAVLPEYVDDVGDVIRVIYIDGKEVKRDYNTGMWRERITRFHGVSISEQRAVFADRNGRLKNNPFYTAQGFVVFGQFPVRNAKRVDTDSPLGFIAIDQIKQIARMDYIMDANFLEKNPNAGCGIQLRCNTWIPCYMKHAKANALWDHAVCIQKRLFEDHEWILQARLNSGKEHGATTTEITSGQANSHPNYNTNYQEKREDDRGKKDPKSHSTLPAPV